MFKGEESGWTTGWQHEIASCFNLASRENQVVDWQNGSIFREEEIDHQASQESPGQQKAESRIRGNNDKLGAIRKERRLLLLNGKFFKVLQEPKKDLIEKGEDAFRWRHEIRGERVEKNRGTEQGAGATKLAHRWIQSPMSRRLLQAKAYVSKSIGYDLEAHRVQHYACTALITSRKDAQERQCSSTIARKPGVRIHHSVLHSEKPFSLSLSLWLSFTLAPSQPARSSHLIIPLSVSLYFYINPSCIQQRQINCSSPL